MFMFKISNIYAHGLKPNYFHVQKRNNYPHGLKLVSMCKICNNYPSSETGIDIFTPNYFHLQNIEYLSTWSETGIDISTPNYFPVQDMQCFPTWSETGIDITTPNYFHIDMSAPNYLHVEHMQYLYTLSENWYRNVETKCFLICKIFNDYQYILYR